MSDETGLDDAFWFENYHSKQLLGLVYGRQLS